MENTVKKYENQILLGISRFGVDYSEKMLIPLDEKISAIKFESFGRTRKGLFTINSFDTEAEEWRFETADMASPDNLRIPAPIFSKPFIDDDAFIKQCNRNRRKNGYLLLDKATIQRIEDNVLPRVLLNGKHWEVDGYQNILKDVANKGVEMYMPFSDDHSWNESEKYLALPYKSRHGFLDDFIWEDYLEPPKNIMLVKMLAPEYMDPIGAALAQEKLPTDYLYERPYKPYHKAIPLSWQESYFATIVNENRANLKMQPLPKNAFRRNIELENDKPTRVHRRKKRRRL